MFVEKFRQMAGEDGLVRGDVTLYVGIARKGA